MTLHANAKGILDPRTARRAAGMVAALLLAAPACRGPEVIEEEPPKMFPETTVAGPWTGAFMQEAVLFCDRLTIAGPKGLLQHVIVPQNPEVLDYQAKTTPEGYRQTVSLKPEGGGATIRSQLDAWSLVVMGRLTVLERPGNVPVQVIAEGDAAWIPTSGAPEKRGPRLEFEGS